MSRLYRMHPGLPSPPALAALAVMLVACEAGPPPDGSTALPDVYLEKLQDAEAARYGLDRHVLERQRLERLLGGDQAGPATR